MESVITLGKIDAFVRKKSSTKYESMDAPLIWSYESNEKSPRDGQRIKNLVKYLNSIKCKLP